MDVRKATIEVCCSALVSAGSLQDSIRIWSGQKNNHYSNITHFRDPGDAGTTQVGNALSKNGWPISKKTR